MVLIGPRKRLFGACTVVGKNWLAYSRHCASIGTQFPFHFFFYMDPRTNDEVPGAISKVPRSAPLRGPTGENLVVFRLAWVE